MPDAADNVRDEFAHLRAAVAPTAAQIDAVEASLERLPEDRLAAVLAALGLETGRKRQAAQEIAVAMNVASKVLPMLLGI